MLLGVAADKGYRPSPIDGLPRAIEDALDASEEPRRLANAEWTRFTKALGDAETLRAEALAESGVAPEGETVASNRGSEQGGRIDGRGPTASSTRAGPRTAFWTSLCPRPTAMPSRGWRVVTGRTRFRRVRLAETRRQAREAERIAAKAQAAAEWAPPPPNTWPSDERDDDESEPGGQAEEAQADTEGGQP